jgi:methylaspartate ammonia-lyase
MKISINNIGSNQTEVQQAGGVAVLYSYSTPVAAFVPGRGAVCTEQKFSVTTSRHVSAAVARWGCSRSRSNVTAQEFAALIA